MIFTFCVSQKLSKNSLLLSFIYGLVIADSIAYQILTSSLGGNCFDKQTEITPLDIILFMSFIGFITGVVSLKIKGFIT